MKTIGVFDSGVGGLSVTKAVKKAFPDYSVIYREDTEHIPYGSKSKAELAGLVTPIITEMAEVCDVIVIACNTVSTVLINDLRHQVQVPLVAMEPMVKPAAAETKSKIIAVCATPATLASDRYKYLLATYAKHLTVLEPDCSSWASLIETNQINQQYITTIIDDVCREGADVIVLGCTHYHWIEDAIETAAHGRATVLQPEQPVISQLSRVLARLG